MFLSVSLVFSFLFFEKEKSETREKKGKNEKNFSKRKKTTYQSKATN